MQPKARAALIHLTASDPAKAANHYSKVFGIPFAKVPSPNGDTFNAPISSSGCTLSISKPYRGNDGMTVYFAVEDISQTINDLKANGGKVVHPLHDLKAHKSDELIGRVCEVIDEFGNRYGLVQYSKAINEALGKPANLVNLSPHVVASHRAAVGMK